MELSQGFGGKLANNEVEFMVLDGVMVILASSCLTVFHPGFGFQGRWNEASFQFRKVQPLEAQETPQAMESSAYGEKNPAQVSGAAKS